MTRDENYLILTSTLLNVPCSDFKLNELKQHFKDRIDSARRFDKITNLASLFKILEKRDILRPDTTGSLKYIAEQLQRGDILAGINNIHQPVLPSRPNCTVSGDPGRDEDRVLPTIDSDPVQRVYNLVCFDIGKKWKEFARALGVGEGYIDELDKRHDHRVSEIVREIITFHRDQCDPRYWKFKLCRGLTVARRYDLSQKVEKIFAMHGLS